MASHNDFGREAEQTAVRYLQQKGYEILERNWRFQKAELDIIAMKDNTLVVVEVKARTSDYFGAPESFVNPRKMKLIVQATQEYITRNDLDLEVRFDIISILKNRYKEELEHIENAFYWF